MAPSIGDVVTFPLLLDEPPLQELLPLLLWVAPGLDEGFGGDEPPLHELLEAGFDVLLELEAGFDEPPLHELLEAGRDELLLELEAGRDELLLPPLHELPPLDPACVEVETNHKHTTKINLLLTVHLFLSRMSYY